MKHQEVPSSPRPTEDAASPSPSWLPTLAAAALIALAAVAAYHNSFCGVFEYDDECAIVKNSTIRQLWPIWPLFSPPCNGETVGGRPLLNVSLALNYAVSGLNVWSYHAVNLAIHIAAALLLMGVLRRTFLLPPLRDKFGDAALWLAWAAALLWTVHPLQTEAVTYVVQRAESLAGLFYLATLYCVLRGATSCPTPARPTNLRSVPVAALCSARRFWYAGAVLACLLGMATKEVMATAPLVVLLYDRTFLAGSFRESLRRRWGLYAGLAATWLLLAWLVLSTGLIFRQPEMGAPDAFSYACSQPGVILYYLRLSLWPSAHCFHYAWPVANAWWAVLPGAMVVGVLLAASTHGLRQRAAYGFLGAWFFLILATTSSIFPLGQLAFEHRMYLSLAPLAVLAVAGGYALWKRWLPRVPAATRGGAAVRRAAPVLAVLAAAVALGWATVARNRDYHSLFAACRDTVERCPDDPIARNNLARFLAARGRTGEAIEHYRQALRLNPRFAEARINLGNALVESGKSHEAIEQYQQALQLTSTSAGTRTTVAGAYNNLAAALVAAGRPEEAIEHFQAALRLEPGQAEVHYNLGNALNSSGQFGEAMNHFQEALRLRPDYPEAQNGLAHVLARQGKTDEALQRYHEALRLKPDYVDAHNNLGLLLAGLGRTDEALQRYREALRLKPDYVEAHNNLGVALAGLRKTGEAIDQFRESLRFGPAYAGTHVNLALLLARVGKTDEAIEHLQEALRLQPDYGKARYQLAKLLAGSGRTREAVEQYGQLLQGTPDSLELLNDLAWLLATHEPDEGGDPGRAVQLAQRARELAGRENAPLLDTLAAAYAADGRFADAAITAENALPLALASRQKALAEKIQARLTLYRDGRPYREAPGRAEPAPR